MYNSKELVVDPELTFLSYNQTINVEFTLEEILDSPLWSVNSDNGLIKAIPLFNCDKITSSNSSDKILDNNKCVILENDMDTIVKCISDDTGSMHYHSVELYAYAPYTSLGLIDEVTVYCILHDEYLNTVANVNVDVYIDDEISGNVTSDTNGVCRFNVNQLCTVKFVYGELESNSVVIDKSQIYTLSIETDKQSLFTDESVTVTGILTVDGEVYADQSIALYDGSSLIDTVVTDSNGEYTKTVSGLSAGVHSFRTVYAHVRSSRVLVTVNAHSYSLSVASTKDILSYADSESATLTATLLDNNVAVAGETLSYVIKHGATIINSGTGTTDSNGEISFNYTATGVGDVTVEVDYGSLLQETFVIQDCDYYADSTKISNWNNVSSGGTQFKVSTYSIGLSDFSVEMKFNTIDAQIMVGNQSSWLVGVSLTDKNLYTHSSSGETVTQSLSTPIASDVWRMEVEGTTIRLYRNNNLYTTKTNCKVDYPKTLRLYPQGKSASVDYVKVKAL